MNMYIIFICSGNPDPHLRHFKELVFFKTCLFAKGLFLLIFVDIYTIFVNIITFVLYLPTA